MKRRRWVWGIVGLALLGGVWAWWTVESSAVSTEFAFLRGAEPPVRSVVSSEIHWTFTLRGEPNELLAQVRKELSSRGFGPVTTLATDRFWKKGAVRVLTIPSQSDAAEAEFYRQTEASTPQLILDEVTVTIFRRHSETPLDKFKSWLGL